MLLSEMYGAFPPYNMVGIEVHRARHRTHICCECMSKIGIGERYQRHVYRDADNGKLYQYKVHCECPYEVGDER